MISYALIAGFQVARLSRSGWKQTFYDSFQGGSLNAKIWTAAGKNEPVYNHEGERYLPSQVRVDGDGLHLVAERRDTQVAHGLQHYASGKIYTRGKFSQRFGLFEICCRIPAGQGLWPAFWLLPEPSGWPPEIDVLETKGQDPHTVYMTNHWGTSYKDHHWKGGKYTGPDLSKGFHIYSVAWTPNSLKWYVDGTLRFESEHNIPQVPMYMIVNLAVGGDFLGYPDASTHFPASFDVKWVRAYKKKA